jgi:ubiquinone/menaquinone biosynthesis C-methylase UbiE
MNAGCQKQDPENRKKAEYYNTLAQTVFFPAYPVIANQILERSGIDHGFCLDIGSGPAHLALALATLSDLKVCAMDNSSPMCSIAEENIRKYRLERRVRAIFGNVDAIPLNSGSMDLVVSRGTVPFWNSLPRGLSECLRVLRSGGAACIGNGFGSLRIHNEILSAMRERDPAWEVKWAERSRDYSAARFRPALAHAGVRNYEIIDDDSGFWVWFRKSRTQTLR